MTYNRNLILKTILLEFFNKKIINVRTYLEMQAGLENYTLVEDFLIECILNYDIQYKDYPQAFKSDLTFLRKVLSVRPSLEKELKKSNSRVYHALFTNLTEQETSKIYTKLPIEEGSRIRKINVFTTSQQA